MRKHRPGDVVRVLVDTPRARPWDRGLRDTLHVVAEVGNSQATYLLATPSASQGRKHPFTQIRVHETECEHIGDLAQLAYYAERATVVEKV